MEIDTIQLLLGLNRQFYQTFALQFSATRQRMQPGIQKVWPRLLASPNILDLGCGNGELARQLSRHHYPGEYTGLDFSEGMLAEARRRIPPDLNVALVQCDLAMPDWVQTLPGRRYQTVIAFAVIHHIPGGELRRNLILAIRRLVPKEGIFILSNWQFLHSPRLKARIQPWESIGLKEQAVDSGDYLLDWRHGGHGLRYVHHFTPAELQELAQASGFAILETFLADGESNRLGLYQIWQAV